MEDAGKTIADSEVVVEALNENDEVTAEETTELEKEIVLNKVQ